MQRFSRSSYDSNFGSDRLGSVDGCELSIDRGDSRIRVSVIHGWPVHGRPAMLTRMTETDWALVVQLFREARSRRGDKGRDDRNFLEALQYFVVHNITWRALPPKFGPWNSIWLAIEPIRNLRSLFRRAGSNEQDGASGADVRFNRGAPISRRPAQKGAEQSGARPLTRRFFNENPPEGRLWRLAIGVSLDRR